MNDSVVTVVKVCVQPSRQLLQHEGVLDLTDPEYIRSLSVVHLPDDRHQLIELDLEECLGPPIQIPRQLLSDPWLSVWEPLRGEQVFQIPKGNEVIRYDFTLRLFSSSLNW